MGKVALGKGLGALIAAKPSAAAPSLSTAAPGERVEKVPLSRIYPTPLQPRKEFRREALEELIHSIREHGIIQPLIVRRQGDKLELIAGERRWRAAQELQLKEAPVIYREATDLQVLELALIENLQREDLNPIEEAQAYARLAEEFQLKQEEIAQKVGKNRATIANSIRLLELHPTIQGFVSSGQLTVGHAKVLLAVKSQSDQLLLAEQVIKTRATVRNTEKLIAEYLSRVDGTSQNGRSKPRAAGKAELHPSLQRLENRLREHLATQVSLHHGEKRGRLEIEYYGNDDLNRILSLIGLRADD
jgi:ParB family chromosome partitioning protein